MKITKNPFVDNAILFGLISAGISILVNLFYYLFDVNYFNWIFGIVNFVVLITIGIIVLLQGIKKYRLSRENQKITYWQCVLQSFLILIIGGIVASLFSFLFYKYFDPEFMPKQIANFAVKMQDWGLPQEKLDTMLSDMQARMTPIGQLKSALMFQPIFSIVLSLIISAFAKKKDNSFESNFN